MVTLGFPKICFFKQFLRVIIKRCCEICSEPEPLDMVKNSLHNNSTLPGKFSSIVRARIF